MQVAVPDGILYNASATRTAIATSCTSPSRTARGTGTTTGSTTSEMPTIRLRCSHLFSFLSWLSGRVLFFQLAAPPAEHLADLVDRQG